MSVEEFIECLKNGQKLFNDVYIDDYYFTLMDSNVNDVEFHYSFVNINFKNCSIRNTKFINCNLKLVLFENCNLSNSTISDCSIHAMEIVNCNLKGFIFGSNDDLRELTSEECFKFYNDKNFVLE